VLVWAHKWDPNFFAGQRAEQNIEEMPQEFLAQVVIVNKKLYSLERKDDGDIAVDLSVNQLYHPTD